MSATRDPQALFLALRESATPAVADAIERLVGDAPDRELCRVNALAFAAAQGLDAEQTIAGFLHAARLGLFELAWNVLCPSCGGVLDSGASLKNVRRAEYVCHFCAAGYEPTLDEIVEVAFTVSPRVRRIGAHDPHTLPTDEYLRQMFFSSGVDLPDDATFARTLEEVILDAIELAPGERAIMSLQLPKGTTIVFDPVSHVAQFIEAQGEPTRERRSLTIVLEGGGASTPTLVMAPGPLRIAFENVTDARTLPGVWFACDALHDLLSRRRPFVTAKRLLTNQTFRDIYRTDTLSIDQRLKITSLTFLFSDLKGSTELYDRVGDLVAYDLVREHFRVMHEIASAEAGAVVKTIGDAVMATFPAADRALAAALRMREAIRGLHGDLALKIGIHEGPCIAVMLNAQQDYFGQTVNIASRVQGLAESQAILATAQVLGHAEAARLLEARGITPLARDHGLRGIAERVPLFEIR
jgi:class 3 adenylate cyclase